MKVLLVDDDPSTLNMLTAMFHYKGFEVFALDSPLKSSLYTKSSCPCSLEDPCPDIILTDVNMPKVSGLEFVEALIQKGCKCKHIALLSGVELEGEEQRKATELGARCFLKPLKFNEFEAWLKRPLV